jgi:DNA-binding response OmpR family regulator
MIAQPRYRPRVVIVDAQPNDFASLTRCDPLADTEFDFLRTGRDALRYDAVRAPELWVINMHLPDMSGLDLYEMLEQQWPDTPVYMVGDDYRPEDEIEARISGATFYFCKPLEADWLAAAISGEPMAV